MPSSLLLLREKGFLAEPGIVYKRRRRRLPRKKGPPLRPALALALALALAPVLVLMPVEEGVSSGRLLGVAGLAVVALINTFSDLTTSSGRNISRC